MEHEIDLKQIWEIMKKRWLLLTILPILMALISGAVSFYVLSPVYESSTTLIVGRKAIGLEERSDLLASNVLEANRRLAKTYGEIAKSRTVREQVIAELKLALTTDQLNEKIKVRQIEDTEILEIVAADRSPKLAADIANATAQKFSAAVIEIKKVDTVSIVDTAVPPAIPVKPKKTFNIALAFAGGLVGSYVLALLLEYLDTTISNSKEAEELLGLPVLGVILNYQYDKA